MHIVINHLPIKPDADWGALAAKIGAFDAEFSHPDYHGTSLVRVSDNEAVVLVLFATGPALERMSREIAAPWFAEHVRPFLAGPVARSTGEVIAGALRP